MSNEREEFRELHELLIKINKRLYTIRFVAYSTTYLGWCIWLTTLILVSIFINILQLPLWVYFAYFIPSLIITIIVSNAKLPSMLMFIEELAKSTIIREEGSETKLSRINSVKIVDKLINSIWITGFIIMGILFFLYGDLGGSTGLLIALGLGNLAIYLCFWIFYRIELRGGLILSTLLLVSAGLNTLLSMLKPGYEWFFAITIVILIYLLLALYLIVIAFK